MTNITEKLIEIEDSIKEILYSDDSNLVEDYFLKELIQDAFDSIVSAKRRLELINSAEYLESPITLRLIETITDDGSRQFISYELKKI